MYELEGMHLKRMGALLKIEFEPNQFGYADCHPWPELGDLPLTDQLNALAKNRKTPLTQAAIDLAKLDADLRDKKRKLWKENIYLKSHYLIYNFVDWTDAQLDKLIQIGYTHIKIKGGKDCGSLSDFLKKKCATLPLKIRIDFNEKLTQKECISFLHSIENLQEQIDFIEDPIFFKANEWEQIQKMGWRLACDRQAHFAIDHPEAAEILVIKPSLHSDAVSRLNWKKRKTIVTTYLGHPVEQVASAYVAFLLDPHCKETHGLHTHHSYQANLYSHQLNWQGPLFTFPKGCGFGFEKELEECQWKHIQLI